MTDPFADLAESLLTGAALAGVDPSVAVVASWSVGDPDPDDGSFAEDDSRELSTRGVVTKFSWVHLASNQTRAGDIRLLIPYPSAGATYEPPIGATVTVGGVAYRLHAVLGRPVVNAAPILLDLHLRR